jgi:hypothetical protein
MYKYMSLAGAWKVTQIVFIFGVTSYRQVSGEYSQPAYKSGTLLIDSKYNTENFQKMLSITFQIFMDNLSLKIA